MSLLEFVLFIVLPFVSVFGFFIYISLRRLYIFMNENEKTKDGNAPLKPDKADWFNLGEPF